MKSYENEAGFPEQLEKPVDATNCEKEPIHLPGSIQPHGVLLAVKEPELNIVQVSANTQPLLGLEPAALLDLNLNSLFLPGFMEQLAILLSEKSLNASPTYVTTTHLPGQTAPFEVVVHRFDGLLIVELEPVRPEFRASGPELYNTIKSVLAELQHTGTVREFCQAAAEALKAVTGFDRVMLYKFLEDDTGHVTGEAREAELDPYLDLHYPASDIPKQARELYIRNPFRLIADVSYQPAALIPPYNPLTNKPLNQSYCWLRSVSPIHIQYLKNMGVSCSMSVSLVKDNRLWGLIACHHRTPKYLPFSVRTVCELLGQVISSQIATKEENEDWENKLRVKTISNRLLENLSRATEFTQGLLDQREDLLGLLQAQGVAICYGGTTHLIGETPTHEQIHKIINWLRARPEQNKEVFYSDSLVDNFGPEAAEFKSSGSGIVAISLSRAARDFVLWFRPEIIQTVNWGGEPAKAVTLSGDTLTLRPRASFELWKQTVTCKSLSWKKYEIEAAQELRDIIIDVILQKAQELARLNSELEIALAKERELSELRSHFLTMTSHEFRTPLTIILSTTELLKNYSQRFTPEKIAELYRRIEGASGYLTEMLDNTLLASRIQTEQIEFHPEPLELVQFCKELVQETGRAISIDSNHQIHFTTEVSQLEVIMDKHLLRIILTNLLTNAIKYSPDNPSIYFGLKNNVEAGTAIFEVKDKGMGIPEEDQPHLYELFHRGSNVKSGHIRGAGLGLAIVKKSVERHQGALSLESTLGQGSTFTVSIPVTPAVAD